MPRGKTTPATCTFCHEPVTKRGVVRHFERCASFHAALEGAARSRRRTERLFHLRAQDAEGGPFWLELEMRGSARLRDLDDYLRAIWLECCGHMSRFSIGGWDGDAMPQSRRVKDVFRPGIELTHIYDFGTESVTRIQVLGVREGKPLDPHPVALLARNVLPAAACVECGAAATVVCMECVMDHGRSGMLCDTHAVIHPHEEYGEPRRLVNSPRLGLCGYAGPAQAPY